LTAWVAPATSVGWPPAAVELLPPAEAADEEDVEEDADDEAEELELLAALVGLLPPAEGEDLLEEQPAASSAAAPRVAAVRMSDVRRGITEDHAPGEYSRHLRT